MTLYKYISGEISKGKNINTIKKIFLFRMPPTQAESVIKNIIREIGQECAAHGEIVPETLVAFMVRINIFVNYCFVKKFFFSSAYLALRIL